MADSNSLSLLPQHCHRANGSPHCIYGGLAYSLTAHLQRPFEGNHLLHKQKDFDKSMKTVHFLVEWTLQEVIRYFAFMDFKKKTKKKQKIQLSAVGKTCTTCVLLTNANICLYKSQTPDFFGIEPRLLVKYYFY